MDKMKIEYLKTDELIPYTNNPRNNDDAVDYVANSIREFGFKNPVIVDKDNTVVCGHTRLKAAKKLGIKEVPCIRADDLTEEQIQAYRLADNKVAEKATWDEAALELEIFDIKSIDLLNFGFDLESDENDRKEEKENNFKQMELKSFEHYDYLVFVFKNQHDWLNIIQEFGVEKVDAGYGKTKKIGIGRVIDGKRLLEKMGYKNIDTEQREI